MRIIQQTVLHEIGNLVVNWCLRRRLEPHGSGWMIAMVYFARPPHPLHDMQPLSKLQHRATRQQTALQLEAPHAAADERMAAMRRRSKP